MLVLCDRIFVVQQWCRLQSVTAVRRSFRNRDSRYHGKNLPSLQSIRNIVDHFKRHGTVTDLRKSTSVNKERPIPEEDVKTVRSLYLRKQKLSIKKASMKTGLLIKTVWGGSSKSLKHASFTALPSLCRTEPPLILLCRLEPSSTIISETVWLGSILTGPGRLDPQISPQQTFICGLLSSVTCMYPRQPSKASVLWNVLLLITTVDYHALTETF